jgi:hypothetical protein
LPIELSYLLRIFSVNYMSVSDIPIDDMIILQVWAVVFMVNQEI